jgi:hypothetical protein
MQFGGGGVLLHVDIFDWCTVREGCAEYCLLRAAKCQLGQLQRAIVQPISIRRRLPCFDGVIYVNCINQSSMCA